MIRIQTPVMKPTMTALETNFVIQPSLNRPRAIWIRPTSRVSTTSRVMRWLLSVLLMASETAREIAPVVVTVMNTEPANKAPIGVPSIRVLRPLTGLTMARMAEAMASGIWTSADRETGGEVALQVLALGQGDR